MSLFSKIKASLVLAFSRMARAFGPIPELAVAEPTSTSMPYSSATPGKRTRVPHSNRKARNKAGLPHGTSGAKLIRRAAEGRIGVR